MDSLDYSDEAKNILNKFYRVDAIVYVEGQDDIPFWEYLFGEFSSVTFEIKDVGGSHELKPYIEKIIRGDISAIVACDADFSYVEDFPVHKNIVRSYGYSIENTMLCKRSIKRVIRSIGRLKSQSIDEASILQWIIDINNSTKDLVLNDVANHLLNAGGIVTGDNCSRFTTSTKSCQLCSKKISKHLAALNIALDDALEKSIINRLNSNDREVSDLLRGHFFFSVALKYVSSFLSSVGKRVSLSKDAFFGSLMLAFEAVFNTKHSHYRYYSKVVGDVHDYS